MKPAYSRFVGNGNSGKIISPYVNSKLRQNIEGARGTNVQTLQREIDANTIPNSSPNNSMAAVNRIKTTKIAMSTAAFAAANHFLDGVPFEATSSLMQDGLQASSSYASDILVRDYLSELGSTLSTSAPSISLDMRDSAICGLIYSLVSGFLGYDNRSMIVKLGYSGASEYAARMVLGATA
jgi:hypothetical protein